MAASGCSSSRWPTPEAGQFGTADTERLMERRATYQEKYGNNGFGLTLGQTVSMWPTPQTVDGPHGERTATVGYAARRLESGRQLSIADAAMLWSTPSVTDTTGTRAARGGERSDEPLMRGQAEALACSLPVPETSRDGETSSPGRRTLNPLFVEWLMGWPPEWTGFACSETAWCLYKQRMRSELSRLGLPPAAPPAQASLFG